jgi:hypothetical protein
MPTFMRESVLSNIFCNREITSRSLNPIATSLCYEIALERSGKEE